MLLKMWKKKLNVPLPSELLETITNKVYRPGIKIGLLMLKVMERLAKGCLQSTGKEMELWSCDEELVRRLKINELNRI